MRLPAVHHQTPIPRRASGYFRGVRQPCEINSFYTEDNFSDPWTAFVDGGAIHESPVRRYWIFAVAALTIVALVVVLVGLDVFGLRERLVGIVGTGSARPGEGKALPCQTCVSALRRTL